MNMSNQTVKIIKYKNAVKAKMHNRRVAVSDIVGTKDVFITLSILDKDNQCQRSFHKVDKGKVVHSGMALSEEAAKSLC